MNQEYVPIEAVADKFSVSISTVRSWIRKGFIPRNSYIKAGNTYRFKLDEIESNLRSDEAEHWADTIVSEDDKGILSIDIDEDA
jgi:predicted site-specific integrase-resolvase